MVAKPFRSRLFFFLAVIAVLVGISTAAYPQEDSVLRVVPKNTLLCLKITNLWKFDEKVADLLNSLNIPDMPNTSIAPLLGQLVGAGIGSMQDLELAGFDMEGDAYIFWTALSPDKFAIVARVTYKQQAEEAVSTQMSGTEKHHRGVPYVVSKDQFAWALLGNAFVYSKDEKVVMEAINTHINEKPSLLHDEGYLNSMELLRSGDVMGYVALDSIITALLPMIEAQAQKAKKEIPNQMKQQRVLPLQTTQLCCGEPQFLLALWLF